LRRDTLSCRGRSSFGALRDVSLPAVLRARFTTRRLRLWCAAAATGQEPYSVAMMIDAMPQFAGWEIQILATDISADALARADAGLFNQGEVQRGLPVRMLAKYFRKDAAGWRVTDELRNRV